MSDKRYAVLIAELGAQLGLPDLAPDEFSTCSFSYKGRLTLNLQRGPGHDDITLFCPVGQISAEDDAALLPVKDALLEANLFGRGTAGAALGLAPESGLIVLSRVESTEGLTAPHLLRHLEGLVAVALAWRDRLAQPDGGVTPPDLAVAEEANGLRV